MMASRRNFDRNPPPFSDTVIGIIMTRSDSKNRVPQAPNSSTNDNNPSNILQQTRHTPVLLPPIRNLSPTGTNAAQVTESKATRLEAAFPTTSTPSYVTSYRSQVSHLYPVSFQSTDSPVSAAVATLSLNEQTEDENEKRKNKRKASFKSEASREQCRTNQARYRQKQREYVSNLASTVARLRDEIPTLEVQRRRLRYNSQQRVWDVVVEYFELFRYGVGDAMEQRSISSTDILRQSETQQQLMFLRSTMASDVDFGDVSGVEVLMEFWRSMTEYHENLEFLLKDMKKVSESIVTATAILSVTVTKTTLECVFPHLIHSENVEDLSLAVKLLGHKLEYSCCLLFEWDEDTSLIARLQTDFDMLPPLQELLGNIEDASRVMEGAVMTPKSYRDEILLRTR